LEPNTEEKIERSKRVNYGFINLIKKEKLKQGRKIRVGKGNCKRFLNEKFKL